MTYWSKVSIGTKSETGQVCGRSMSQNLKRLWKDGSNYLRVLNKELEPTAVYESLL